VLRTRSMSEFVYIVYNHSCGIFMGVANTLEEAKRLCPVSQVMEDACICVHRVPLNKVCDEENGALTMDNVVHPM